MADDGDEVPPGTEGLVRHLCRAAVIDFRVVGCADAARMLREDPAGETLAKKVEELGDEGWLQLVTRVANDLRPVIRNSISKRRMAEALLAAIRNEPSESRVRRRRLKSRTER